MGILTDLLKEHRDRQNQKNDAMAGIYLDSIRSGNLSPIPNPNNDPEIAKKNEARAQQFDYATQQIQKIYGSSKESKGVIGDFRTLVGGLHNRITGTPQNKMPAPPGMTQPPQSTTGSNSEIALSGLPDKPGVQGLPSYNRLPPPPATASTAQGGAPTPPATSGSFTGAMSTAYLSPEAKTQQELGADTAKSQQELQQRKQTAEAAGLKEGTRDYQEYIATGKFPTAHTYQPKPYKDPSGKTFMGLPDEDTGQIHNIDTGEVVPGATSTTASADQPKRFSYIDPKTGKNLVGFQIGDKLYDQNMQELPPDTQTYVRGLMGTERSTTSTDPYGNVTTTRSQTRPVIPGSSGAPRGTTGGGSSAAPSAKTSRNRLPAPPKAQSAPPPLDSDGHVPQGAGNPQVVEAANQLLDGQDINKLPTKVREPAAAMARQYGWEQGKFTPKEQVMLRESSTFLQKALNDPSMAALDGDFMQRMKVAQAVQTPDKEGMVGRGLSTAASMNLSDQQAEFVRMYNQLVGTISGLAQLVRSGRATEATIDRLKAELPNPTTTKNSQDGRERIKRLIKEIDVAMKKGTFEGADSGGSGGGGKELTANEARDYLKKAGGDKDKARQMARADGHTF